MLVFSYKKQIYLVKLFIRPTFNVFLGAIVLCGFSSFIFGWHVHEKAILMVIIPFRYVFLLYNFFKKIISLLALKDRRYFTAFCPLVVAGYVSLFPLIFTPLGLFILIQKCFINIS